MKTKKNMKKNPNKNNPQEKFPESTSKTFKEI